MISVRSSTYKSILVLLVASIMEAMSVLLKSNNETSAELDVTDIMDVDGSDGEIDGLEASGAAAAWSSLVVLFTSFMGASFLGS
ncbi:unnamed protein product [Pseudo-nitzschia multistriata]|uniref:Uncharacterized protein n=1 Tax=Pseudo-nitzschia multistriata TaxID=183589 RepID=A0A448ZDB4_9STRA|nr:unnamed protein product [Pseudo-nitzschia multistriata]